MGWGAGEGERAPEPRPFQAQSSLRTLAVNRGHSVTAWGRGGESGCRCDKAQAPTVAEAQWAGHTFSFSNIQPSFPTDWRRFGPLYRPRPQDVCSYLVK